MLLYAILGISGLSAVLFWKRLGIGEEKKIYFLILAATGIIGLGVNLNTAPENPLISLGEGSTGLLREEAGGKKQKTTLDLSIEGIYDGEYEVEIQAQKYSEEEIEGIFEEAGAEAERVFLGNNEDIAQITEKVVLPETLRNNTVKAAFSIRPFGVIASDGSVKEENVTPEGSLVSVDVNMRFAGREAVHTFHAMVFPRQLSEDEQVMEDLKEELLVRNEQEGEYYTLPSELDGYELRWSERDKETDKTILLLGLLAMVGLYIASKQDKKKAKDERNERLVYDYPAMVSTLELLLESGMTMYGAWERMVRSYVKKRENGAQEIPVYEEMLYTYRHIQDGLGEKSAYEEFAMRVNVSCYRKLMSMIIQNLRKGNTDLCEQLEKETVNAYEQQRSMAKIRGEKAQTKILMPMMLNLIVVIVVIVVPAVNGMSV